MHRRNDTLKKRMLDVLATDMKNEKTFKRYKTDVARFTVWAKTEHRIRIFSQVKDPVALLNAYSEYLQERGFSANSIHRYLAPVCKGFGVHMQEVNKPKRTAGTVTKTRDPEKGVRGRKDLARQWENRVVLAQRALGIRKAELYKLRGGDLMRDVSGYLCVHVRKGKGGKEQHQRILPADVETVKALFEDVGERQRVFSPQEITSTKKIALHALRAEHARAAYEYYKERLDADPRQKERLRTELMETFKAYHPDGHKPQALARFVALMDKDDGTYRLRGENRTVFEREGRATTYDRVALMAVSVWHLSHWRLDVTVKHYMR